MDLKGKIADFTKEFNNICSKTHRSPNLIQILYATKYLDSDQMISFIDIMRQIDGKKILIGENKVQDWEKKYLLIKENRPDLLDYIYPIMIGNLQKNKINKAITYFNEIHSIDSLELAEALNARLQKIALTMPVYLEVNISGEKSKHGFDIRVVDQTLKEIKKLRYLEIKGLMSMAPYKENIEEIRGIYRKLKQLAGRFNLLTSMGMSHDWKIAIEEGSDMIRIGSAIFN